MEKLVSLAMVLLLLGSMLPLIAAETLKEKDRVAIEKYNGAKQRYQNAVSGAYEKLRQDYLNARGKLKAAKSAENDEKEAFEKAKARMLRANEAVIKHLEVLKVRVEVANGITESDRVAIIAEIDRDVAWLQSRQGEIQSAADMEQLREISKAVQDYWTKVKAAVKRVTGEILAAKVNYVITRAENTTARIDVYILKLKAQGKDTSELERWLAEFKSNIELAKQKNEAASEKFVAIKDMRDADKLFNEGHAFLKEANSYLKDAHKALGEMVRALKAAGGTLESSAAGES